MANESAIRSRRTIMTSNEHANLRVRMEGPSKGSNTSGALIHDEKEGQPETKPKRETGHFELASRPKQQQESHSNKVKANLSSYQTLQPLERLNITIVLPFVIALLLPTSIKLTIKTSEQQQLLAPQHRFDQEPDARPSMLLDTSELLLALVRLPFDRIRLQTSGGLSMGAHAKEIISNKDEMQEEETHTLLVAPAEHRSSYLPAGGPQAYGPYGGEPHVQAIPAGGGGGPDYGLANDPMEQPQGAGGEVVAEPAAAQQHNSALQARSDLPVVRALNVKCEKNHMTVNIVFDRPFYGMVFSKGHYNDQKCVHLPPNSGQTSVNFDIHLGKCGMSSSDASSAGLLQGATSSALQQQPGFHNSQQPNGVFIENTIIIQYDPQVQEIFDQARKLRCTWYDYYEKSVTFRPYNVDMLDAVTANFLGDNIQCWMQIQVGKGPWSSEVAGIVKIGQTMTMVLAIKDDENKFDMFVRNCFAHDGKHAPIQLVDEYGCVARPKIMGKFQKVNKFGPAATVVSYAHFQAFKFPDSMSVHFQCVIQVCRSECPQPRCEPPVGGELGGAGGSGAAGSIDGTGNANTNSNSNGQGPPVADYATSGTEMVATKETLPVVQQHQVISGGGFYHPTLANHSNVQLKLDESQGRVQVKLDTSMMAGLNSAVASNNGRPPIVAGPLPPHLLHSAQAHQKSPGGGISSASGPKSTHHSTVLATVSAGGRQQQPEMPQPLMHQHQQVVNFSPQFPLSSAARRPAVYTSRLGDLSAKLNEDPKDSEASAQVQTQEQRLKPLALQLDQLAPYEGEYPLSLIASPRGLRMGTGTLQANLAGNLAPLPLHRVRRDSEDVNERDHERQSKRRARHLRSLPRADSTSVQTRKTIQVVSPDDVAFSLLEEGDSSPSAVAGYDSEPTVTGTSAMSRRRRIQDSQVAASGSSVCFSTTRFLWTLVVTLAALLSSIVIVAYVILRQRSLLEQKLSAVYTVEPQPQFTAAQQQQATPTPMVGQRQVHNHHLLEGSYLHWNGAHCGQQQQRVASRQREETRRRNNYLARLYSQFAPASYWR